MPPLVNKCSFCQNILETDAVFCIYCGTNQTTGERIQSEVVDIDGSLRSQSDKGSKKKKDKAPIVNNARPSRGPFISGKSIFTICLIAGLVFAWFKYFYPFYLAIQYDKLRFALSQADFGQAMTVADNITGKGRGEFSVITKDLPAQIELEQKYIHNNSYTNPNIALYVDESMEMAINLIYVRFHITNYTDKPIGIHPGLFYLRTTTGHGEVCLTRLQNTEVSVGVASLGPGKGYRGGICVKFVPAIRFDPEGGKYEEIFLVYNNGSEYVTARINPMKIDVHGAEYKFKTDWQGGLDEPRKLPVVSAVPTTKKKYH